MTDDELEVTLQWPGEGRAPGVGPAGTVQSPDRTTTGGERGFRIRSAGGPLTELRAEVAELREELAALAAQVERLRDALHERP